MCFGDFFILFNGEGGEWFVILEVVDKKIVIVLLYIFVDIDCIVFCLVILGLLLIKGDCMDFVI